MLSGILVGAVIFDGLGAPDRKSVEDDLFRTTTLISREHAQRLQEFERAIELQLKEMRELEAKQFGRIFAPEAPNLNSYGPFSGLLTVVTLSPMTTSDEEIVMIAMDHPAEAPASREQAIEAGAKLFSQGF
jgi:hypothetical protein